MPRLKLQLLLLISALCTCLGIYSFVDRRGHRRAERLEFDRAYLAWDWKDTPEEVACQSTTPDIARDLIPQVVHFVLIAERDKEAELQFYQYLAIKAALIRIQPNGVKVHSYSLNESNRWWQLIRHQVTLVIHEPSNILKTSDGHVHSLRLPHQTDILRLEILYREGGIYLDTDVYALQSFSPLLQSPKDLLMGHEGGSRKGLGNAVLVARPGSPFIAEWLAAYYRSFDDRPEMWNHHSIKVPAELAIQLPDSICKLSPSTFFWPTWSPEHIESMHAPLSEEDLSTLRSNMSSNNGAMYPNQLAYHAWGNLARANYLNPLDPDFLMAVDSRFNILLRDIYLANT